MYILKKLIQKNPFFLSYQCNFRHSCHVYIILLLSAFLHYKPVLAGDSMNLNQYKWKSRILLTCKSTQKISLKQTELFEADRLESIKRDLILIEGDSADFRSLNQSVDCEEFKMVLIGKDGQVKSSYSSPTPMSEIFSLIDTMPMRKKEMKNDTL